MAKIAAKEHDSPAVAARKSVTLKDVAAQAGVSKITVSAVLNRRSQNTRFSEATRQRVLEAAQSLHYYPNAIARGMTQKRMNTIGVVLAAQALTLIDDPYVCGLLDGIMAVNMNHRQNTTVFTGQIWSEVQQNLPVFCDGRCDGLIIMSPEVGTGLIPALLDRQLPFVLINGNHDDPRVLGVTVTNREAMYRMVQHVLSLGHRRIAFLNLIQRSLSSFERLAGYHQALAEARIAYDPDLVLTAAQTGDINDTRTQALLQLPPGKRPTAFCCGNDRIAMRACAAVREAGLRVPEDISVTGFDDGPDAATHVPPLTTVHMPMQILGQRAAEMLLDQIQTHSLIGRQEVLPMELVFRRSVTVPAA